MFVKKVNVDRAQPYGFYFFPLVSYSFTTTNIQKATFIE